MRRGETRLSLGARSFATLALSALLLVACGSPCIGCSVPVDWVQVPLKDPGQLLATPEFDTATRQPRVVVLAPDRPGPQAAASLRPAIDRVLHAALADIQAATPDPALAARLQAFVISPDPGPVRYVGPDVADFLLRVTMKADAGRLGVVLHLHALPSLRLLRASEPLEVFGADEAALRAALAPALAGRAAALLAPLAPQGHVTERRVKGSQSMFRIATARQGMPGPGAEIDLLADAAAGFGDERLIARGTVVDWVGSEGIWVRVSDERAAAQVRQGDRARWRARSAEASR